MRMTQKEKVMQYLLENETEMIEVVSMLNEYNWELEHLQIYENDEDFFTNYFEGDIMKAVNAVAYGSYNSNEDYVRFDGYENVESISHYEHVIQLKQSVDSIAEEVVAHYNELEISKELMNVIEGE